LAFEYLDSDLTPDPKYSKPAKFRKTKAVKDDDW